MRALAAWLALGYIGITLWTFQTWPALDAVTGVVQQFLVRWLA